MFHIASLPKGAQDPFFALEIGQLFRSQTASTSRFLGAGITCRTCGIINDHNVTSSKATQLYHKCPYKCGFPKKNIEIWFMIALRILSLTLWPKPNLSTSSLAAGLRAYSASTVPGTSTRQRCKDEPSSHPLGCQYHPNKSNKKIYENIRNLGHLRTCYLDLFSLR